MRGKLRTLATLFALLRNQQLRFLLMRVVQLNPQDLADDQTTMVVDQTNVFAFKIDDIEERHSHVNFEALATSSGAYSKA